MVEPVRFAETSPGLIEVQYPRGDDMDPALQGPLLAAVEAMAARGPVAILFRVSDALPKVKLEVPTFWLGVVGRSELRLLSMAIVSRSSGVKFAAKGFKLSNKIRGIPLEVETFDEEEPARAWARSTRDLVAARLASGASPT